MLFIMSTLEFQFDMLCAAASVELLRLLVFAFCCFSGAPPNVFVYMLCVVASVELLRMSNLAFCALQLACVGGSEAASINAFSECLRGSGCSGWLWLEHAPKALNMLQID
mgnify:CR=1 FL=1